MIRSMLAAAACAAFVAFSATAQVVAPVQLPEAARRALTGPRFELTPQARAQIASRLTGRTIAIEAISGVTAVTPRQPISGPDTAPALVLSARRALNWTTASTRDRPAFIAVEPQSSAGNGPAVLMAFQAQRSIRYLALCDINNGGGDLTVTLGYDTVPVTWETTSRAAFLIPPRTASGVLNIELFVPHGARVARTIEVQRCEISQISF